MSTTTPRRAAVIAALTAVVDRGEHTSWIHPKNATPAEAMTFFLGSHRPYWLAQSRAPLFISVNTMGEYKGYGDNWPIAKAGGCRVPWALDSGGFTELKNHGEHRIPPDIYGSMVTRFMDEYTMTPPNFAAIQDFMCEPWVIAGGTYKGQRFVGTGLTLRNHLELTVMNYCYLAEEFDFINWMPTLQGYTLEDYLLCEQLYLDAGVDLAGARRVGLGSVCRRESTAEIAEIVKTFAGRGYRLHGFGVKTDGLKLYGKDLASADSMAWSTAARLEQIQLPDTRWGACTHPGICNNCLRWAMVWREMVLRGLHGVTVDPDWEFLRALIDQLAEETGQLELDFDFDLIGN